jgi:hypothetical protein
MGYWYLPPGFGDNTKLERVPRHPFRIVLDADGIPVGFHDPMQPLAPELWYDYWSGALPPAEGDAKTGSVATSTYLSRDGTMLVVRVQCQGEPETDYAVDLDLLAEELVKAHLANIGKGQLQRARLRSGEVRRYVAHSIEGKAPSGNQPESTSNS